MYLDADPPSGATTGRHSISVATESGSVALLYGQSKYTGLILYTYGKWVWATEAAEPQTEIAQLMVVRNIRLDSTSGLRIKYHNATDANQTGLRCIRLVVRKIKVEAT